MRILRHYYDALVKIDTNNGSTKEVPIDNLDWLIIKGLIKPKPPLGNRYEFELTGRGIAALKDRPLDVPSVKVGD